jgi:hypothetical protein
MLGIEDQRYYVCCGNYIPFEKAEPLARELFTIRDMTPDAIQRLYKERRKAEAPADSMGAGLGLIEIARRSTEPMTFDIQPVNSTCAFFAVKATI